MWVVTHAKCDKPSYLKLTLSKDLKKAVARELPDDKIESIVYPKYETTGELAQAAEGFLEW